MVKGRIFHKLEPLLSPFMMLHFESPFHAQHTANMIRRIVSKYSRNLVRSRSAAPVFDEERLLRLIRRIAVCDSRVRCPEVDSDGDPIVGHDEKRVLEAVTRVEWCTERADRTFGRDLGP
jgi:hypothetical protein